MYLLLTHSCLSGIFQRCLFLNKASVLQFRDSRPPARARFMASTDAGLNFLLVIGDVMAPNIWNRKGNDFEVWVERMYSDEG